MEAEMKSWKATSQSNGRDSRRNVAGMLKHEADGEKAKCGETDCEITRKIRQ